MKTILKNPLGYSTAAVLATFLWGSAFPAVKTGYKLNNILPEDLFLQIEFAGYRFVLASLMLIFICFVVDRNFLSLNREQSLFVVKIGLIQTFFQYIFFYIGISYTSGVTSSIIAGTLTFFQLAWAFLLYQDDKISWTKIIASAVSFAGIAFYLLIDHGHQLSLNSGILFMFAAMVFASLGNVLYRKAPTYQLNPLKLTALQMLLGGVALLSVSTFKVGLFPFSFGGSSAINLLYLSFISAASFLIWNTIMTYNKSSNVSVFLFLIPIWGSLLSSVSLGEQLNWYILPTLLIVSCSIIVTQLHVN